jgi:hypothetical protein
MAVFVDGERQSSGALEAVDQREVVNIDVSEFVANVEHALLGSAQTDDVDVTDASPDQAVGGIPEAGAAEPGLPRARWRAAVEAVTC